MRTHQETAYSKAERFATLTKEFIMAGNILRAKKCFALAEKLFQTGSNETKNAISNVFLFSVSAYMEWHHCSIHNLFPQLLKEEYRRQVDAIGV